MIKLREEFTNGATGRTRVNVMNVRQNSPIGQMFSTPGVVRVQVNRRNGDERVFTLVEAPDATR